MDFKSALSHVHEQLGELETSARKLENQNFADLIKHARGRLSQALEHPDLEAAGEQLDTDMRADKGPEFPFGGATGATGSNQQ